MSFKAKNLAYERPEEPAFLARMRAQVAGNGDSSSSQGPMQPRRTIAARNQKRDDDDGPTIVDDDGNALDEEGVAAIQNGEGNEISIGSNTKDSEEKVGHELQYASKRKQAQEVSEAGAAMPGTKKRKALRIVADSDEKPEKEQPAAEATEATRTATSSDKQRAVGGRKKKKAKVALSFDADV